jgi:hypothetical protein
MDNTQRALMDDKLDEALMETFPASDPPANTVETGISPNVPQDRQTVADQAQSGREAEESNP